MKTLSIRVDDDAELAAIRARMRQQILQRAAAPPPLTTPQDVADASFEAFVREHPRAVIDCWAPWCGPCRIVGPIVDALAAEWSGRVAFGKLNVDLNPMVSQALGIQSIPTMLVYRDGRLVDRVVGALPKPQLAARLSRSLGLT